MGPPHGGALGIGLMLPIIKLLGAPMRAWFPSFPIEPETFVYAAVTTVLVGVVAAVFPAWRAIHLRIADGLRRIG